MQIFKKKPAFQEGLFLFFTISLWALYVYPAHLQGSLLALDNVAAPNQLTHILWLTLPAVFFQKSLVLAAVAGTGLGLYLITRSLHPIARFVAQLFFLFNPFFAEHLAIGQWDLLVGVGLTAWILYGIQLYETKRYATGVGLILLCGWVLLVIYPRGISFVELGLIAIIVTTLSLWRNRPVWQRLALGAIGLALVSFTFRTLIEHFADSRLDIASADQLSLFAIGSGPWPWRWLGAINYLGFWAERAGHFHFNASELPLWYTPVFILLPLTILGWRELTRERPFFGKVVALLFFLSFIVVVSNTDIFQSQWLFELYNHLGFSGLRETSKFMGIMMVAQSIGIAYGISWLIRRARRQWAATSILTVSFLILLYAPTALAITRPALRPVRFPEKLLSLADKSDQTGRTISFPWHRFQVYPFTNNRRVDQLGPALFPNSVFNEMFEFSGILTASRDPWQITMANLSYQSTIDNTKLNELLDQANVSTIIIFHTNDYQKYIDWAERQHLVGLAEDPDFSAYSLK